tara:strand:- start:1156 stop:1749 length:594 start_codon:yes stop_codon:yes gene_type:complete
MLWEPNEASLSFSRMYDESWVEKLYRGFKRHLTVPFEFICFTDKERTFSESEIKQEPIESELNYGAYIEPFKMNEPMILVGLDTVITGNIDHLAEYCLEGGKLAVPRDPFFPEKVCNGVALIPGGSAWVFEGHEGQNDMDYIRSLDVAVIDDIWPGEVVSYKGHVKGYGLDGVKICYFHGEEKPHQLTHDWIEREWR